MLIWSNIISTMIMLTEYVITNTTVSSARHRKLFEKSSDSFLLLPLPLQIMLHNKHKNDAKGPNTRGIMKATSIEMIPVMIDPST